MFDFPRNNKKPTNYKKIFLISTFLLCIIFVLFLIPTSTSAAWLTGWSYRKQITIDHTYVDSDLTEFPLYVKITNDADIGDNALVTGYDIRFTSSDGSTLLAYEIETWTGGAGADASANIWVKVPTIAGASNTVVYLYYGNAGASTDWTASVVHTGMSAGDVSNCSGITNAQCVWREGGSQNFKGVWHLGEGTGVNNADSTVNANTGTPTNGPVQATGKVDGALSFDGSNYTNNGANSSLDFGLGNFSASAWIKTTATVRQTIVHKFRYDGTGNLEQGFLIDVLANGRVRTVFESDKSDGFSNYRIADGSNAINDGDWHYVQSVRSAQNTINLYVDGLFSSSNTLTSGTVTTVTITPPFMIGYQGDRETILNPFNVNFNGSIDEVRISSTARSADWIKFEYYNQSEPDAELAFSSQQDPYTWIGSGNWSTASNWAGGVVPTTSNIAIFNASSTNDCTIDTNISVAGINIQSGYTGIITQGTGNTVTVGSSSYTQADGTFSGGNSNININNAFSLTGGLFTATSGTMTFRAPGYTASTIIIDGDRFNHNNGTIATSGEYLGTHIFNFSNSSGAFYNFVLNNNQVNKGASAIFTVATGDVLVVEGTLTMNYGNVYVGTVDARGDVIINTTFNSGGSTGTLLIGGSNAQTVTINNGVKLPAFTINNIYASVNLVAGATMYIGANCGYGVPAPFNLQAGTFTATTGNILIGTIAQGTGSYTQSGGTFNAGETTITIYGQSDDDFVLSGGTFNSTSGVLTLYCMYGTMDFIHTVGGVFNHNNGTVVFMNNLSGRAHSIDVSSSEIFYNLTLNNIPNTVNPIFTIASGDTLVVNGNLTLTDGNITTGTIDTKGNLYVGNSFDGGTGSLTFSGSSDTTFTNLGGTMPSGTFTVNKDIGKKVSLASALTINSSGQDLILTSGSLGLNGNNLTVNDQFIISANATLQLTGDETLNKAPTTNSGTIEYNAISGTRAIRDWSYQSLKINGSRGTFTLGANESVAGNFTITAGTFNPSTYTITGSGTNTLSITDTANVGATTFAGSYASFETITLNEASTINYNKSGDQTIDNTLSYYNLTTSGTGIKTLVGNTTVPNTLTIGADTTLAVGTNSLAVSTTLTNSGTITASTGTITIPNTSSGAWTFTDTNTIPQADYTTLTLSGTGKTFTLSGNTTIQNNLTINTNNTLDHTTNHYTLSVDGTLTNNGTILNRQDSYTSECNQTTIQAFAITSSLTGNKAYYIYRQDNPQELNSGYIQSTQWQDTDPHDGAVYTIKYRNQDLSETTLSSISAPPTTCGSRTPTTISSIVKPTIIPIPETQPEEPQQPQTDQTEPQPEQILDKQQLIIQIKAKIQELMQQLILLLQERINNR